MNKEQIDYIKLDNLIPYKNNPRDYTRESIEKVKNSIAQFGFINPIVIDLNNVIIAGHHRYFAAKELGFELVPTIKAEHLTHDEVKAYRLADNKTGELSNWVNDKLIEELESIEIDMSLFGFEEVMEEVEKLHDEVGREVQEEAERDDEGYYGDERENTFNAYNLHDYDSSRVDGFYQMPYLKRCDYIPKKLVGFNYVLNKGDKESAVHFYLDDYQFERIWNRPHFYIDKIKEFKASLTPDFSLYADMPMAMKVWNVYRSRLIGQIMQDKGIEVIPTLSWAERGTFDFAFDGLEPEGVYSVSTIGVKRSQEAYNIWAEGMSEAIKVLRPKALIVYGGTLDDYDFKGINTVYVENEVLEKWKNNTKNQED